MNKEALKELMYKMADDSLIIGHRNSEWTGIGPTMEEDISFSSMAQDKIGHAWQLYKILNEQLGEADPDTLGFLREAKEYRCCQLVEQPIGEYDFSLIRHFLFDHAEYLRYKNLRNSSYQPLADLAKKIEGELKYHIFHADMWMKSLANGTEVSKARVQTELDKTIQLAAGIFEAGPFESQLKEDDIFIGEEALFEQWLETVTSITESVGLTMPAVRFIEQQKAGRYGFHSEHLQSLLDEMSEVLKMDIATEW